MNETMYRGIKIFIEEGNFSQNRQGQFTLIWPGHKEQVESTFTSALFILGEAQDYIDDWIVLEEQKAEGENEPSKNRDQTGSC
jgi:hypothetical protein